MNPTLSPREVSDLKPGDHVCWIYESEEQHSALLTQLLRQVLETGQKALYLHDINSPEKILGYLRDNQFDPTPFLDRGQLCFAPATEYYMSGREFHPDRAIEEAGKQMSRARAEGYDALCIVGEQTWALGALPGLDPLIEYEARAEGIIPQSQILALCLYDRRLFKPGFLLDLLATHRVCIVGTELHENFHSLTAGEFLRLRLPEARLRCHIDNLTTRKRMEKALRESERWSRSLFQYAPDPITVHGPQGEILDANARTCETLGYSQDELLRIDPTDVDPGLSSARITSARLALAHGNTLTIESTRRRKDGSTFPVEVCLCLVKLPARDAVLAISRDLSARYRTEQALRESEERYRTLVQRARSAIFEFNLDSRKIIDANEAMCKHTGYTKEELLALDPMDLLTDEGKRQLARREAEMSYQERATHAVEYRYVRKDGEVRWAILSPHLRLDSEGPTTMNIVAQDITDQKRAEESIRKSREQLHALAARLQSVREQERIGMARRIHDDIGHALTALKMDLSWLARRIAANGDAHLPPEIPERIGSMSQLLNETIEAARQTASELRPGVLDDLGLVAALEWQVRQFRKRGIRCDFKSSAEDLQAAPELRTALYRICQELLTNVARHAEASAVHVKLERCGDQLVLEVLDNGTGISSEQVTSPSSLGLLGVQERMLLLKGEFSISGAPGKGTTAIVRVPLGAGEVPSPSPENSATASAGVSGNP